jgi:hypothetical protein
VNRRIGRVARLAIASAMLLSFAGTASAADTAMVRVLHASPDAPAVDVYLDDAKVDALTNVPFGVISGYLPIPAGDHNVKVYATGTTTGPVIDADVTVATGKSYTIAATGAVAAIAAQVIEDAPSPSSTTAQVRVVHFSADAPAVDIATAGADPVDAVVKNLAYPTASGYLALPGGSYDLEVRLAGTTTVALALPDVTIANGNSYSVFAVGSAASTPLGGNALQVVVAVDATAQAAAPAATPPATDSVVPGVSSTTDGLGPVIALIVAAAAGIASFVGLTVRQRRSLQD